jgi:hypothetical protein
LTTILGSDSAGSRERCEPLNSEAGFTGIMLVCRATFPEGAEELPTGDRRAIHSLALIPLPEIKMSFTREFGSVALEERHSVADITELLNSQSLSIV